MALNNEKISNENAVDFQKILEKILLEVKNIIKPTMSIEEIKLVYTDKLDQIILEVEKSSGKTYVGGEFKISYVDKENYTCEYSLYFQDESKKVSVAQARSENLKLADLDSDTAKQIADEKEIKFDIDSPSDDVRKNFEKQNKSDKNPGK